MIDRQTIDNVIARANIEDVVGSRVTLKKKGAHLFGCCPFHNEDTPSFAVYAQSGVYHCFGCGKHGNAISFLMETENMTFVEAVKTLAKRYDVEIKEAQQTAEQQMAYHTKEAMWSANERLLEVYQEEFNKSKEAKAYAHKRWGVDYCNLMGIGYCPNYAKLVDNAKISDNIIDALHLKGEKGFDVYGGRVVIPIRDRMQRIIGFTARRIDGKNDRKYINSSASLIYEKSKSAFGIDKAWNSARKAGKLYLVEGAPDCMRLQSIGVLNTLAPLGTAWTDDHFRMMKQMANSLCFLPDADPPKGGAKFGAGIEAVMKSGEMAMKAGFSVTVKQIPIGAEKADPDSYCETIQDFNCLDEQDYILWLADLLFEDNMTTIQQGVVINRIATLMTYIEDNTTSGMIVAKLAKYAGKVGTWNKAIDAQRKAIAQNEAREKAQKESDLYRLFGFNVEKNKSGKEVFYYSISENGGIYEWSNFVMKPLFHIKDVNNAKRIYSIRNVFGSEEMIELKQEDLVSLQKFKVRIESLGNFVWKATQKELDKLKQYLYEKTETATEVKQLGWNRQGFYAFGNGVIYEGQWHAIDEDGIVRLGKIGNYYLPALSKIYKSVDELFVFERKFVHLGLSKLTLREYTDQLFVVYGDNGRVGFLYTLASMFRDIVDKKGKGFPILNMFGQRGSGKTKLGVALMAFFIIENTPASIHNTTQAALSEILGKVSNAMIHIDEYKNDIPSFKVEYLKGIYDGIGRNRMNMDKDQKSEATKVNCGVILTGQEMPTVDNALFSRLVYLTFASGNFTPEQSLQFQRLTTMRQQGMSHLTIELQNLRDKVENTYDSCYDQTTVDVMERLGNAKLTERIIANWVALLAMLRCLEPYIDTSLSYSNMFEVCINGILNQNAQCEQNNELSEFWNLVQYLSSEGEIQEGGDYRVEVMDKLKTDTMDRVFMQPKKILLLQKSRIFQLYKKSGRLTGENILPEGSLKHYLINSNEYLGEKNGVRFKVYHKGILQYQDSKPLTNVQRTFCFDYDKLVENYNINLEKVIAEPEPDEQQQEEKAPF